MQHTDTFRISHKPYAIDLSTVTGEQHTNPDGRLMYSGTSRAVWYRRKQGVTYACLGTLKLWSHNLTRLLNDPTDPAQVLSAELDSRYGGDPDGRWDGEQYWGAQRPGLIEEHLAVLRPMLDAYPAVPAGYEGWWRF